MNIIASILLLILVVSCSSAPSKDQLKAFRKQVDAKRMKGSRDLGPSTNSRLPLQAGQWVTVLNTSKDGKEMGLSTFKVLGVSGKSVRMEVETISAKNQDPQIMQYEVDNYPMYNKLNVSKAELESYLDNLVIKKMVMKNGKEPAQEMPTAFVPKGMLKDLFANGYSISTPKKEACSSSYLNSGSCIGFDFEVNVFGFTTKGKSYAHSAVPVMGFVKSDSEKTLSEVVNFGLTGAKSSL